MSTESLPIGSTSMRDPGVQLAFHQKGADLGPRCLGQRIKRWPLRQLGSPEGPLHRPVG